MRIMVVKRYDVHMVQNNRDKIYLFGDNLLKRGKAGQAIIRDEYNALGIPTKRYPSMDDGAFFSDRTDEIKAVLTEINIAKTLALHGYILVLPEDGIGTGLAKLPEKSPCIFNIIQEELYKWTV